MKYDSIRTINKEILFSYFEISRLVSRIVTAIRAI